jgi:hypothetical protein
MDLIEVVVCNQPKKELRKTGHRRSQKNYRLVQAIVFLVFLFDLFLQ